MDNVSSMSSRVSPFQLPSGMSQPRMESDESSKAAAKAPSDSFEKSADTEKKARKRKDKSAVKSTEDRQKPSSPSSEKEYTILAYLDGCNNLEDCILDDLKEMESTPHSDNYNLVAQFSRFQTKGIVTLFLSEALGQAFQSKDFKESLQQIVQDRELIEGYSETLKNPETCQTISQVLLERNPELQDKLDALVSKKVKEAISQDKALGDVVKETAAEVLKGVVENEKLMQEEKSASDQSDTQETKGAATASPAVVLSASGLELLDILGENFGKKESTVSSDFIKAAADLLKESKGKDTAGLFSAGGGPSSSKPSKPGSNVIFVDTQGRKGTQLTHDDYSALFGGVDSATADKEPAWRGVRRYEVEHSDDTSKIKSKVLADLGQKDMSASKTLEDFLIWGMKKYPAKHYIVLFSDHGAGFLGAEEDRGNLMSMPTIRETLDKVAEKTGKKPDIIAFDTCLMAQAEVAYELKDSAKYLVASEETIGGDGYPYSEILPRIDAALSEGKSDPKEISKIFIEEAENVNESSTITLSAIDLGAIGKVANAANDLAKHILEGKADLEDVRDSLRYTQHYSVDSPTMAPYGDFRDLWDMADKLQNNPNIKNKEIKNDLTELKKAIEAAVVSEEHSDDEDYEGSHGISIYAPRREKNVDSSLMEQYDELRMSKRTKWNELIKTLTDYDGTAEGDDGDRAKLKFIELPHRK
ncbi:MAG: clostripain-related cysteine peptidase [Vulcanimicrobiota bacterium]